MVMSKKKKKKKKSKIGGTDKKIKQWYKAKNVMMTFYFFLGIIFMLLGILIMIGVLTQGEILSWFGL